jgi:hypothetical protein
LSNAEYSDSRYATKRERKEAPADLDGTSLLAKDRKLISTNAHVD